MNSTDPTVAGSTAPYRDASLAVPDVAAPRVGGLPSGALDAITDVGGVTVGHCTLAQGAVQTGVTVLRVHGRSHYLFKVPAAATVFNGFGKSVGLMQVDELGTLETPIALTNTFSVPAVAQAQIRQAIAEHPEIGRAWPTLNPLVFECNDGYLNDIQAMAVQASHYAQAVDVATARFAQGAVGAGRGMSCFGLKGGIGSASRLVTVGSSHSSLHGSPHSSPHSAPHATSGAQDLNAGPHYTVGALVLSNFGRLRDLIVLGQPLGVRLAAADRQAPEPDKGSIIMLLATDAPLDARQLRRLSARAGAGLARTGSYLGHGSGDIALAFSTAYTIPQQVSEPMPALAMLHEQLLDGLFQAAADATEQAILSSLWHAESVSGRDGHARSSLRTMATMRASARPGVNPYSQAPDRID